MGKNILTDDMLQAAFALRKQEPWNVLGDYNVFAVKLSCGETGYCSVMGEAGIMHGLGLYVGRKQFSSFLRSLTNKKNTLRISREHHVVELYSMFVRCGQRHRG